MVWDKSSILRKIRQLYDAGQDLSYNALARRMQPLVSAAAYHFGSYRKAVQRAGVDYAEVTRRPRWSKQRIIALIKEARRNEQDLHWSAVTSRKDELGKAAFASLQPRLFGRWDRALHAAGLDADEVSCYRKWDRNTIVFELRSRAQDGEPLNSGAIQREDPGLHAAAVRHFGSYDKALQAAKLDPAKIRERQHWSRAAVLQEIKRIKRSRGSLSDSSVRKEHSALYGAAVRLFGTFTRARAEAGVTLDRRGGAAGTKKRPGKPSKTTTKRAPGKSSKRSSRRR